MNLVRRTVFAIPFVLALAAILSTTRAADKDIAVAGLDTMKYDVTAIDGEAGQTLNITLTNTGKMPKAAIAHNFVILKPGTDWNAFVTAAARNPANGYIPVAQADAIIAATKLLGPGESDTLHFTPTEAGTYDFVCTFPAHAMVGMHGTITIK